MQIVMHIYNCIDGYLKQGAQSNSKLTEASYHRVCIMQSNPEEFDLLDGQNQLFHVTFDISTPRPHFIIAPKNPTVIKPDFKKMTEGQTDTLMNAVESMDVMKGYEIKSGILSFHRGSWFTKDPKRTFHAHICVDVGPYLKVYDEKKNEIAQSLSWDQQKVSSYRVTVLGYNLTQAQYFFKALSDIKNLKNVEQAVLPTVEENDITLVLHRNYPKIGFVGKKNIQPKISLKAIEKFAQNLGLTNIELTNKDENKGCHVCLYLGEGKLIFDSISDKAVYNFLYI